MSDDLIAQNELADLLEVSSPAITQARKQERPVQGHPVGDWAETDSSGRLQGYRVPAHLRPTASAALEAGPETVSDPVGGPPAGDGPEEARENERSSIAMGPSRGDGASSSPPTLETKREEGTKKTEAARPAHPNEGAPVPVRSEGAAPPARPPETGVPTEQRKAKTGQNESTQPLYRNPWFWGGLAAAGATIGGLAWQIHRENDPQRQAARRHPLLTYDGNRLLVDGARFIDSLTQTQAGRRALAERGMMDPREQERAAQIREPLGTTVQAYANTQAGRQALRERRLIAD